MSDTEIYRPRDTVFLRDYNRNRSAQVRVVLVANETLIIFVQVKYQGLQICQSKLNCALLESYVVAIFLCWASLAAPWIFAMHPIWEPILTDISFLLGALATALLLVIGAPPLGWLVFLVWLLHFVKAIRQMGVRFYIVVYEAIVATLSLLGKASPMDHPSLETDCFVV